MKRKYLNYVDYIHTFYKEKNSSNFLVRNVTFQVTDDCPMNCSYCYQINKGHKKMSKEVAKKCIDILFDMYYKNEGDFINKNTKAIILEFIGGEPLMAIDIIDYTCSYFMERCIEENHPWAYTWRASMISNGALYFNEEVQNFLKKFQGFVSFSLTIDGPKEIHDSCRVYHDGKGNFDDVIAAKKHYCENYGQINETKVTIAPENLAYLSTIIDFFVGEGITRIPANTINEIEWTFEQAKLYYSELKKIANYLLTLDEEITITLFDDVYFCPMREEENQNWCGGTGKMLAFDPDGIAYPCLRYMPSSLGEKIAPIVVGNIDEGLFTRPEWKETKEFLDSITRRSQSTDECFNCPIARGCAWCSAWNYQHLGSPNKRFTGSCAMHKARSLANVYYWNKYYQKQGLNKKFKMHLPKEEALKIIDIEEYNFLKELQD